MKKFKSGSRVALFQGHFGMVKPAFPGPSCLAVISVQNAQRTSLNLDCTALWYQKNQFNAEIILLKNAIRAWYVVCEELINNRIELDWYIQT